MSPGRAKEGRGKESLSLRTCSPMGPKHCPLSRPHSLEPRTTLALEEGEGEKLESPMRAETRPYLTEGGAAAWPSLTPSGTS